MSLPRTPADAQPTAEMPAPATLFRLRVYDADAEELIRRAKQKLAPILKLRDGGKLKKIEAAQTPEELLDLSPQATGLAADAWHAHMRSFGPPAVTAIAEALPYIRTLEDETTRRRIESLLITELRWQGDAGVQTLLDVWESLDRFTRSLACVVLGLAGRSDGLEHVWEFYREASAAPEDGGFVGALWAMLDLGEPRLADELHRFLVQGPTFYELFGFLARAGAAQSLGPLLAMMSARGQQEGFEAGMAAAGIAQRVGRSAAGEALRTYDPTQAGDAGETVDLLLSRPSNEVRQVFAVYYRGFRPADVQRVMDELE